jgi:hypothetical protein
VSLNNSLAWRAPFSLPRGAALANSPAASHYQLGIEMANPKAA